MASRVLEAIGEEVVDEGDVFAEDRGAEEIDNAGVVIPIKVPFPVPWSSHVSQNSP